MSGCSKCKEGNGCGCVEKQIITKQGLKGDQGDPGPQGPIGATGIGIAGPQGAQGIEGERGPNGIQGIQGIQGIAGVNGTGNVITQPANIYNESAPVLIYSGDTTGSTTNAATDITRIICGELETYAATLDFTTPLVLAGPGADEVLIPIPGPATAPSGTEFVLPAVIIGGAGVGVAATYQYLYCYSDGTYLRVQFGNVALLVSTNYIVKIYGHLLNY